MSKIPVLDYLRPASLREALELLDRQDKPVYLVAGGTDFIPRMRRPNTPARVAVDITALRGALSDISLQPDGLHIGAMATHTQISESPLVQQQASVLAQACRTVGSRQIRNRATIGGNIGNASPAGDSMPALLTLDAVLTLRSVRGERKLPLQQVVTGPSRTALEHGEMITELLIPAARLGNAGWYKKMSNRNALTISLVSAAIAKEPDGALHLAFGSVAPVPIRFAEAEAHYLSHRDPEALIAEIGTLVKPISDVRASAEYRRQMAMNLVREGLYELGVLPAGKEV